MAFAEHGEELYRYRNGNHYSKVLRFQFLSPREADWR